MYTSLGADAGMKYPSTGAGAEITADAGAVYLFKDVALQSQLVLARSGF